MLRTGIITTYLTLRLIVFLPTKMRRTFEKVLRIYYSAPFWGIRMFGAVHANNIKSGGYNRGARSSAG